MDKRKAKILCTFLALVILTLSFSACQKRVEEVKVLTTLETYGISDATLLYTAKTADLRYIKYQNCITITEGISDNKDIVIPATIEDLPVVSIENGAFSGNKAIQRLIIGPNVVNIGSDAFSNCTSLISVQMSGSVTRIGERAFANCRALRSVIIPAALDTIPSGAFSGCTSLKKAVIESRSSSSDPLIRDRATPRSLNSAFSGCTALVAIWIPSDIGYVDSGVLGGSRYPVVYSAPATAAAIFAAHQKLDFGITTQDEFDMDVRQYSPVNEETYYDQVGRSITAGKFNITLKEYSYFTQIGTAVANEGEHFVRIVFEITNTANYTVYFDGIDPECYSWARDNTGIMRTYVKKPLLAGKNVTEYDVPAGEFAAGETKVVAIVLKINTKSACVSVKFPDANDRFLIK